MGKIDAAKIGFDAGLSARFHPDFVLIENFRQIKKRDRPSGFFGRNLIRKLILRILNFREHLETFPHSKDGGHFSIYGAHTTALQ